MTSPSRRKREIARLVRFEPPGEIPEVEIVARTEEEAFVRLELRYRHPDGDQGAAFLLVPEGPGPHPGVLALHQHNSQWELGKSEVCGLAGDRLQAFAPALARRGICVLAPDALGFESRLGSAGEGAEPLPPQRRPGSSARGWLQHYNQMCYRLVRGDLLIRKVLSDASLALSILVKRDEVDRSRVGALGHSYGGNTLLFLAALDERIAFSCVSGAVCSYRYKMRAGTALEMSLVIPDCAPRLDVDDLVRCVAPRRMFLVSADRDPMSGDAEEIFAAARATFAQEGCAAHLEHLRCDGGHALDRARFEKIVDWMGRAAGRGGGTGEAGIRRGSPEPPL